MTFRCRPRGSSFDRWRRFRAISGDARCVLSGNSQHHPRFGPWNRMLFGIPLSKCFVRPRFESHGDNPCSRNWRCKHLRERKAPQSTKMLDCSVPFARKLNGSRGLPFRFSLSHLLPASNQDRPPLWHTGLRCRVRGEIRNAPTANAGQKGEARTRTPVRGQESADGKILRLKGEWSLSCLS